MCSIAGYIGKNKAVPYLLKCLENLEYRGYDSAGVAVNENGKINVTKCKGKLSVLQSVIASKRQSEATSGIGHTRWATHGKADTINAHPHLSQNGTFAVVHNGIIENYAEIKNELMNKGVSFVSETDTEVIAALLEKNYDGDVLLCLKKTLSYLKGSYAIAVLCKDFPDEIYCSRFGSPLVMCKNKDGCFISSDAVSLSCYSDEFYYLEGGESVKVTRDGFTFFSDAMKPIEKPSKKLSFIAESTEKGGYSHFMLKEIYEQPEALKRTCEEYVKDGKINFKGLDLSKQELMKIKRIIFAGCGSAYHVALSAKYVFEKLTGIYTSAEIASQWRYSHSPVGEDCLVIAISQSGETADTLAALKKAKEYGARTLSVVNVPESSVARESDTVLYTKAGSEIAVATTKAYSCQLSLIYLLGIHFADIIGTLNKEKVSLLTSQVLSLCEKIKMSLPLLDKQAQRLASELFMSEHIYFIGRGCDYAAAVEGALKLKEISYIHCEAYAAGELKHGTISLIEKGTPVVAVCCDEEVFSKTLANVKEVLSRGASVVGLTAFSGEKTDGVFRQKAEIQMLENIFMPSAAVPFMQLLAFHTAKLRGCDIDKPRNLAKSVTVE